MISRSDIDGFPVNCGGWWRMQHYIFMAPEWFKILPADPSPGPGSDFDRFPLVQIKIGYDQLMRKAASFRAVALAVLLAASHLAFASHVASHISFKAGSCEWCVCQVQTLAGPLTSAEPVSIERQSAPLLPAVEINFFSESATPCYQPRAPPLSS